MTKPELEALIRQLPPELQQEVADFVEFLLQKRGRKVVKPLRQDWAGALKQHRDQYTALSPQKRCWSGGAAEPCLW
jgi:mRNA-degrading endonuclease RelE of RelBE toxin-antitoxin system